MVFILEGIFKGFVQWIYSLCLEMVQYIANSLLEVFQMDLSYFRQVAPVTDDILSIVIAVGWALLLGNLVFQAMKSMVIGLGFEGEDPKLLFTRTFVFAFLLLVSQQICEIGLGISSQVIALLQVPTSVTITIPDENNFTIGASWLLIIIVGIVVMWQFVKLCFEVAERYVVTAILVLMAPLAFGMGGSKNTEDIFKGWCRMFGSMCVMMIMNVIFLKLLISALGYVPSGVAVLPWMLLIVGIARVARKIDGIIARMGLNPALTGDGLGRGLPGMVAYAVVKGIGSSIAKAAGNSVGNKSRQGGSSGGSSSEPRTNPRTPPPPPSGSSPGGAGASSGFASTGQQAGTQADPRSASAQGGAYASKQTVQGAAPNVDEVPPDGGHIAGAEQPAADRKGGKEPTVHTHGARRSSVPPEARGTRTSRPYTAAFIRTGSVNDSSSKGTPGRTTGPQDGTLRPPVAPSHGQADGKRPDRAGGTRRSAVTPGTAAVAGPERTTHTSSTRETMRERPPLQQDRTPKIPTPPGVAGGEKSEPRPPVAPAGTASHGADTVSRVGGSASATTEKSAARPPVGSQRPREGGASTPGTAGTRPPIGGHQSHGGEVSSSGMAGTGTPAGSSAASGAASPFAGMAGRHTASPKPHTSPGGESILPDMAGSPRPTAGSSRISHAAPPPGTAGTASAAGHEAHSVTSSSSPSGTAGTRRPGGTGRAPAKAQTPSAATAGTAPQGAVTPPGVNHGTRRMKGAMPPTPGGTGKSPKTRKKRSEP